MKKFVCVAGLLMVLGSATSAVAQAPADGWQVTLSPYLMGASMSGVSALRGVEVDVDVSASDIFSNLQFGAMGFVVARKGNWGVGGDFIWMALGTSTERPPANIDMDQGGFAFYGLRRIGAAADLTFGARVNLLQGRLKLKGPLQIEREQDKAWVDPLVGVILRTPGERRVGFKLYSEIGGFGMGSDFAWQIFPTVSIGLTKRASFDIGYRWLDMDYEDGEGNERFAYDVLTQGPVAGFAFRF